MQKINELQATQTEEELIKFLDEMSVKLKANGNEVRAALKVLKAELQETQHAVR